MNRWIDLSLFAAGVTSLGIGLAMKDPAYALMAVGGIVAGTVLVSRLLKRPRRPKPVSTTEGKQ